MKTPAILHVLFVLALLGTAATPAQTPPPDPEQVAAEVTAALQQVEGVPWRQITVAFHASTIVLNGEVASPKESRLAEAAAADAAQGLRVSNNLAVVAPEAGALAQEQAQAVNGVKEALLRDPRTANLGVAVSFSDERVIGLHGLVPSVESRRVAAEVARQAAGHLPVDNRLAVPGER